MKILTVVGARPEFIQIAPVDRAIRRRHTQILVHTGQHYDDSMSDTFFRELSIHEPEINLGVGSGTHAEQTAQMLLKLEEVMLAEKPDFVVSISDTNSTLATALTAAKLVLPLAHIEAGLRSRDRAMPEEINRIVTDAISDVHLAPTKVAVENLRAEGISEHVYNVGDVRMDTIMFVINDARERLPDLRARINLPNGTPYVLATIHRAENTDHEDRLRRVLGVLALTELPVVLPVHPRLAKMMRQFGLKFSKNIVKTEPIGFLDTLALLDAAKFLITDSGGLQKEAYMLRRPAITMRSTTEWTETVDSGWNRLCEPEPDAFRAAVAEAMGAPPSEHPPFYGKPGVSERIVDVLEAVTIRKSSA
jgi:UDP-N-acetylglucosamine 2-epimerase